MHNNLNHLNWDVDVNYYRQILKLKIKKNLKNEFNLDFGYLNIESLVILK